MSKYYINYGTGAWNEYVEGELEYAQKVADEGASYTQCSISVFEVINGKIADEPECTRQWYGVEFDPDDFEDGKNANIIGYGNFGYYDEWSY